MVEIMVFPLINFFVVTTIGLMGSTTLMGIPIIAVVMHLLIAVINVIPLVSIA